MIYIPIRSNQLTSLQSGELIAVHGQYYRSASGHHLETGPIRLPLIGEAFSWVPPQGCTILAWGEVLRFPAPRLLLHDLGRLDAEPGVSMLSQNPRCGQDIQLLARVYNIGDQQIAVTSDRRSVLLAGDELDERTYALDGQIVSLNPPTLLFTMAVPITLTIPAMVPEA